MKKCIGLVLSLFVFIAYPNGCGHRCSAQYTGKTVLANGQVPFTSVSPELVVSFRNGLTYDCNYGKKGSFQAALFGSRSMKKNDLARYFLPHGATSLLVVEDGPADNFSQKKNLLAQNFNIFTKKHSFKSEISLAPVQTMVGCGLHWRKCFLYNPLTGNGVWASVSSAIMRVKNTMNLREAILNTGGGPDYKADTAVVGSMKEALNQYEWKYGKIPSHALDRSGLADIELKIGYSQSLPKQLHHLDLYGGLIVPTGNKYSGKYVFEPIVGRGKHVGLMFGGGFGKDVWVDQDEYVNWEVSLHGEYLFKNKQHRSFDLVDKPWSRYLELYIDQEQAQNVAQVVGSDPVRAQNSATPGINVLTRSVYVTPGFAGDMNTAFVYHKPVVQVECGYNLFVRQSECVKFVCPWSVGPAIKYAEGVGRTNPIRDITGNKYLEQKVVDDHGVEIIPVALVNFDQSLIMSEDIDMQSATTPELIAHTLYIACGKWFDDERVNPVLVNGGILCTFSQENAVINKWLMWFKAGVSF